MIIEIGHFLLINAFVMSLFQLILVGYGLRQKYMFWIVLARPLTFANFWLVLAAFLTLIHAYAVSDFSVRNVAQNSHSQTPFPYKITALWGNHEGSMLLWLFILSFFSLLAAHFCRKTPPRFLAHTLLCQNALTVAFLAFILLTSNPFERLDPPSLQGAGLNPLLQDMGLVLHPPLLYLGFVGFSVAFSLTIAALCENCVDRAFARLIRPWILFSWLFLTSGIGIGSYWAYYELGWGGYWFWDPVENASLMPWLAATALLHSALVMEKRAALKQWTVLLVIITFSLALFGTFLVRSNLLSSVHNFANVPGRGLTLLAILTFFSGFGFLLFAIKAPNLRGVALASPLSREGALIFNNIFLLTSCACIFIGTLYPFLLEAITGDKITVGPPFFNLTFGSLMGMVMLVMPFAPLLAWKRADIMAAAERLMLAALASLAIFILTLFVTGFLSQNHSNTPNFGTPNFGLSSMLAMSCWLIMGALCDVISCTGGRKTSLFFRLRRFFALPFSIYGRTFAHMGVGITLAGIVFVHGFEEERITHMSIGQSIDIATRSLRLDAISPHFGANYLEDRFIFTLLADDIPMSQVHAAKRIFSILGQEAVETSEVGLLRRGLSHYYVAVGGIAQDETVVVHVWYKPYVLAIWLGGFFMIVGGAFSLADRKKRNKNPPASLHSER